ncbi:WGR domain-containing protein [Lysobacter capsici]|uniref:WGR domain-containing protein n=1 Tax=Lysobacter capsici TaxID=435897 RepID=UPI00398D0735
MRRFEYVEGSSSKFWEAEQDGSDLNIRWGRIGTAGQSQTKAFADANKAAAALIKLIDEKTGKGYVEAVAAAGASIGKTADKPKVDKPKPEAATETVATSPASPGAAAPHAAAAQVAAPQPAPVAAPNVAAVATNRVADAAAASVAAASDTPPWLTDGAPLDIGPDLIKLALATRRHPKPIADTDPLKLWLAAREILLAGNRIELSKTDPAWQEALAEAGERLQSRRPDGSDASTAALLALTMGYGDRDAGVPFVGFLVARHGLLKAVEHLLEAQRSLVVGTDWDRATQKHERFLTADPDRPLGSSWHGPLSEGELAFREHLAAAPQACTTNARGGSSRCCRNCIPRARSAWRCCCPTGRNCRTNWPIATAAMARRRSCTGCSSARPIRPRSRSRARSRSTAIRRSSATRTWSPRC